MFQERIITTQQSLSPSPQSLPISSISPSPPSTYTRTIDERTNVIRQSQNAGIQSFRTSHENILTRLLEAEMWFEAYIRCLTHPLECLPVAIYSRKHVIYAHTPLGIACRKFTNKVVLVPVPSSLAGPTTNATNSNPTNPIPVHRQFISQFDIIKALFQACPCQLRCNQIKIGLTPLLDIICNPHATVEATKFLIDSDFALRKSPYLHPPTINTNNQHQHQDISMSTIETMSIGRRDSNGLLPLHHLIGQVHRNNTIVSEEFQALELIEYIVQSYPNIISAMNHHHNLYTYTSPLIHLLSQKASNQNKDEQFMPRIAKCATILLSSNPDLIQTKSVMTSCTPLHMALRNGYGESPDLIALLLKHDTNGHQVKQRNKFGDLPIHINATIGTCKETWNLLLNHISTVSGENEDEKYESDPITGPSPFIWTVNSHGYTPLHLSWMRQINGKQPYPMSYTKNLHISQRRGMYFNTLQEVTKQTVKAVQGKSHELESGIIDLIACECLGPFWEILKLLLKTIQRPTKNVGLEVESFEYFLHATCSLIGPLLPRPIFELIFTIFKDQAHDLDVHKRVPLHYACASFLALKESSFGIPSKSIGWFEMDSVSENIDDKVEQCIIVDQLLAQNPKAAALMDTNRFLPLHFAMESEKSSKVMETNMDAHNTWSKKRSIGHCVIDWTSLVKKVAKAYPDVLGMPVPKSNLYPFMMAAANPMGNSIEIIYCLLKMFPTTTTKQG